MEIVTVGKVTVAARIENLEDVYQAARGALAPQQVRSVDVADALVDTGATLLSLPARFVRELGLNRTRSRTARTAAEIIQFGIYQAVRLTVQERDCVLEVAEIPDDCPVLIGQIPLEMLDFVVDPVGQKLIGNPDHGGKQMIDMF
ncbi:MAG: retroviral-like aspartic protease family protein [Planctomycetota bacterium]